LQYSDRTSSAAKAIGKVIGVSPIKVDHAIGGYFGTWGRDLMSLSSTVDTGASTRGWDDTVFVRRFIKDPTRSSDVTHKFWEHMGVSTGKYNQAAKAHSELINRKSHESDALAAEYLSKLPAALQGYVILKNGKPAFKPDERRLHPLQRAYEAVSELNGIRREMDKNSYAPFATGERRELSDQLRGQIRDAVRELAQMEMRNALVIMKEPGYAQRPLFDTAPVMEKLKKLSPEVADDIATRYATAKIYPTKAVALAYPKMQSMLMRSGSEADLSDLASEAGENGYEFGAERVKRPQRRRIQIAPPAPAPLR
jgi:hypothetical protein